MGLDAIDAKERIELLTAQMKEVEDAYRALKVEGEVPFVWDIAFVEIFEGENEGFDIVISNPPYVRQESISDPRLPREKITTENKKEYKAKLMRSVYQTFPRFFGYKSSSDTAAHKLDAKSDLYIYFYFHGLALLNEKGSSCFITSNSWLDVGYGKDLQEFLLRRCRMKLILDNKVRRSFASADVNTIIALLSAPDYKSDSGIAHTARFVMFKVPFEYIISPVIFDEIESANDRISTPEYRIFPIQQGQLLEDGYEPDEDETEIAKKRKKSPSGPLIKVNRYIGNKWGGKYLRAPDIYWTILEKGKGKLVRLGDIAEIHFGIKTGANEFFYLDEERIREWGIEDEFLKSVIKSPRECKSILIDPKDLKFKIFMCHKDKKELKGTIALEYIRWGESQGFHKRPSCTGRMRWWDLGEQDTQDIVLLRFRHLRNWTPIIKHQVFIGDVVFVGILNDYGSKPFYSALLNSTIHVLSTEILGRVNLGEGLLTTYGPELIKTISLNYSVLADPQKGNLLNAFEQMSEIPQVYFQYGKNVVR